ncbi:MAG: hypothetical protein LBV64_06770 [Mediterranea sp.]|nr:hypothetical protein [Mediterranea sp.]
MKIYLSTILVSVMALILSSCGKVHKLPGYKELHYDLTVQGYVKDTVSLANIDINLHFTKDQSIEEQLKKFNEENGLRIPDKLKFTSGNIEQEVDFYLRKTFGKNITYNITAQGVVEFSSFIRFNIDHTFKK